MSKWFADSFKIACGICVGYGLLFVYGAAFQFCRHAGGWPVCREVSVAMKAWLSDVLKIGFGASLGFMMLFVLAFVFDDWVIPAVRMLVGWLSGFFE